MVSPSKFFSSQYFLAVSHTMDTSHSARRLRQADRSGLGRRSAAETPTTVLSGASCHKQITSSDKPALVAEARIAIEFTCPTALGKTYRIEDSFDLATWETVESGIAGNGGQIQRFYSTRNMAKRYFRVEEDGQ